MHDFFCILKIQIKISLINILSKCELFRKAINLEQIKLLKFVRNIQNLKNVEIKLTSTTVESIKKIVNAKENINKSYNKCIDLD